MGKSKENFEIDLKDPVLLKDIRLSEDKLAVLRERRNNCFLCKWILEDYERNGTLTGVKREGGAGVYEIMPIRGEINHVWLEVYGKEYPFKRKVIPEESRIHGYKPHGTQVTEKSSPSSPSPNPMPSKSNIPLSKPKKL